ncbi:MAG TPA: hypothetical protein VFC18_11335 [Burkholderiales bacterium]|nr:hypothetical protein [Burkholderiales bacterium]
MTVRKSALAILLLGVLGTAMPARAQVTEIYKCIDQTGRPLYTSDKRDTRGKKCELVSREINVVPAQAPSKPFPKESASQRESAKERQREILEKELATEQQLLAKAQKALEEQEAIRTGDEKNYARVLERLQPFKDSVETHLKNIEALKRELSNLYR